MAVAMSNNSSMPDTIKNRLASFFILGVCSLIKSNGIIINVNPDSILFLNFNEYLRSKMFSLQLIYFSAIFNLYV